jgi:transitional endoplasmic reticulum ATPase
MEERTLYAEFWRNKLLRGEKTEAYGEGDYLRLNALKEPVEFPEELCKAIAGITKGFSFAYMQEAFVATLLAIATDETGRLDEISQGFEFVTIACFDSGTSDDGDDKDLEKYILWREIKRQIKILREDIDDSDDSES